MIGRRSEAGDGKIGCILWTAILAVGLLIAWKAIPVKIAASELYDFMDEQAKWAGRTSPEVLRRQILERAEALDLPLAPEDLTVVRSGNRIRMRATFMVPLEFPGYVYEWHFDLQVDRPIFIV
jgi:hypothetical protein